MRWGECSALLLFIKKKGTMKDLVIAVDDAEAAFMESVGIDCIVKS